MHKPSINRSKFYIDNQWLLEIMDMLSKIYIQDNQNTFYDKEEQDKSSHIEQQPPFGDRKHSITLPQKRGWGEEGKIDFNVQQ